MTEQIKKQNFIEKVYYWVISFVVPVFIVLGVVRLMLNPWYVEFEYRTPGFPPDSYGFSLEERLDYSKTAIEYLINSADISFLGDLRFPNGQIAPESSCRFMDDCNLMYNERELKHMLDVKIVVQNALRVWLFASIFLFGTGIWAWRSGKLQNFLHAIQRGGFLTVGLIIVILALTLLAFGFFFVFFHNVFFDAGTWTFQFSDTLIRLFPERFWRDTFIVVGVLSGLGGLIVGTGLKTRFKRKENS